MTSVLILLKFKVKKQNKSNPSSDVSVFRREINTTVIGIKIKGKFFFWKKAPSGSRYEGNKSEPSMEPCVPLRGRQQRLLLFYLYNNSEQH